MKEVKKREMYRRVCEQEDFWPGNWKKDVSTPRLLIAVNFQGHCTTERGCF